MTLWSEARTTLDLRQVAASLGIASSGRRLRSCPACRSTDRPVAVYGAPSRWHCHRCEAGGDVLDLVGYALAGARVGEAGATEAVRGWLEARGVAPGRVLEPHAGRPPTAVAAALPAVATYPPAPEVRALLRACGRPQDDAGVSGWVRTRLGSIDLPRGLLGALPVGCAVPTWARLGRRAWPDAGYRALLPLYDPAGVCRSVRARSILTEPPGPKATAPRDYSVGGLVLADPLARLLLRDAARPPWWRPGWRLRIVVAEGEPDYLAWACASRGRWATIGIIAGAWNPAIAARLPGGTELVVATHHDRAGDRYAALITQSVADRCDVVSQRR